MVKPQIQKQDTNMRKSIPAGEKLALTLRYLATGGFIAPVYTVLVRIHICYGLNEQGYAIIFCQKLPVARNTAGCFI